MLKLLEKSEITKLKNQDRVKEQAEGLKLARRVDSLREIQAQEELSLKRFREQTVKQIHEDIKKESKPLEELRKEVKLLKEQREESLKPITKELEELERVRDEINRAKENLKEREKNVKESEISTQRLLKEASDEFARSIEQKRRTDELLQDADLKRFQSEKTLKESEDIKFKVEVFKRKTEEEIAQKQALIASRTRSLDLMAESIKKHENDLSKRELRLKDREQKLLRNVKRFQR